MIEIRKNDDGTLDEVCANPCRFHLEQMDDGHWWMEIEGEQHPARFHINLFTKGKTKIHARIEAT
jgi:hypothetical protein